MSDVPKELHRRILSWMPAKSVLRFRCVCKEWRNTIDSPAFVKLHLEHLLGKDAMMMIKCVSGKIYPFSAESHNHHESSSNGKIEAQRVRSLVRSHGLTLIRNYSRETAWVLCYPFEQTEEDFINTQQTGYFCITNQYMVVRMSRISDARINGNARIYETLFYCRQAKQWHSIELLIKNHHQGSN